MVDSAKNELLIAIGIYFFATVIDYLRREMLSIAKQINKLK